MVRQPTGIVVFRNLYPVSDVSRLPPESQRAANEFRALFNIGPDVDLSGEWWGVMDPAGRRFVRCSTRQEAETIGTDLARSGQVAAWIEDGGHTSAKLLAAFR